MAGTSKLKKLLKTDHLDLWCLKMMIGFGYAATNEIGQVCLVPDNNEPLCVDAWLECVPAIYAHDVSFLSKNALNKYLEKPKTENTRMAFIEELHHRLVNEATELAKRRQKRERPYSRTPGSADRSWVFRRL